MWDDERHGAIAGPEVETLTFVDGLGRRSRTLEPTGEPIETLRLCKELSEAAATEATLIERAGRLATFSHPGFAQVRRVERLRGPLGGLAVVSTAIPGIRLSEVLRHAQRKLVSPDLDAAACLLHQITGALADFHRHSADFAHGALGPERIVVRPDGRAVIVEQVLAPAIERLLMGRAPLWTQFRIAVPAVAGTARFDQLTDLVQLGVLALTLALGRPIRRDEYPHRLHDLLAEASTPDPLGDRPILSRSLRTWILRTLQLETRSSFRTAADAETALDAVLAEEPRPRLGFTVVARYLAACAPEPDADQPAPVTVSVPAAGDVVPSAATGAECAVVTITATDRFETVRRFRPVTPVSEPLPAQLPAKLPCIGRDGADGPLLPAEPTAVSSRAPVETVDTPPASAGHSTVRVVANAARASLRYARAFARAFSRSDLRVTMVSIGLVALYGVTYLGARGYLGLSTLISGRGTLVVESRPVGADLYVDGFPSGRTPATLELAAGEHTLALRTGTGTTLVPVMVVAGARRVEHIIVRQRRPSPRAVAPPRPIAILPGGTTPLPVARLQK